MSTPETCPDSELPTDDSMTPNGQRGEGDSGHKAFVPTVGAWVRGPFMSTVDRDALVRRHFEEYAAAIAIGEGAKRARLELIAKLRSAVPEYYTQERLAELSGMTQQNISYHLGK
ncbi:hypothetical protein OHB26_00425 [Nocardia sp. NBC_01503]|uniref:hypothetical protein n=1 Tax=Nocardia sp. NBC_01503 TaxID=2975997 RepID=UPI002E7ACBB1|nr:hypothetical protein [Nocardia sp. NBC_01503]WTL32778.1 hypothetical protein OHB26_00425 [Nocardia sp. NBC_01503]